MNDIIREPSSLDKLIELTPKLPVLAQLVAAAKSNINFYKVEFGTCVGIGLFKSDDVAIQKTFASAGSTFPKHIHTEHEFIILISGTFSDKEGNKYQGPATYHVPPNIEHAMIFETDCWMVAITIPPAEGYPDA